MSKQLINRSLLINISKIKKPPTINSKSDVLDITNTLEIEGKLDFNEFIDTKVVYQKALKLYQNFSEQLLSIPNILSYQINQLPVFWLSQCGIKHPIKHWAKDFFLLLAILQINKHSFKNKYDQITILIPKQLKFMEVNFNTYLKQNKYPIRVQFLVQDNSRNDVSFITVLKTLLKTIKKAIVYKQKENKKEDKANNIFLINSKDNLHTYNNQYLELKKIFDEHNKDLQLIPLFEWRSKNKASSEVSNQFYKAKPNKFQLLFLLMKYIKTYFSIQVGCFKKISIKVDKLSIPVSFLKQELLHTLNNSTYHFVAHEWLSNYFKTSDVGKNVFYEDELYEYGRTISSSVSLVKRTKPMITSYGIQHGNFSEIHTVYSVYDIEVQKKLPLPDYFITWGKSYQDLFLRNNSIPEQKILPIGNLKYINSSVKHKTPNNVKKVLWCLTTYECFLKEWEVLKEMDWLDEIKLTIRLHPMGHIHPDQLHIHLNKIQYELSKEDQIEEAFINNDLIITSAHSTVFLDAISYNKYCICITSRIWNGNTIFDSSNLITINNTEELKKAFIQLKNNTMNVVNHNKKCIELEKEKWNNFVASLS